MLKVPEKLLVIVAHQDDETIGCGGTIRKWADMGTQVDVVFVTNGNTGVEQGSSYDKEDIVSTRMFEAKKASLILNASSIDTMDISCQCVQNDQETFHNIIKIIREKEPNLVFTHYPKDKHRDHRMISEIVKEACWKANENILEELGSCHKVEDLWAIEIIDIHSSVDFVVDITETYSFKKRAMNMYLSQHNIVNGIFNNIEGLARARGYSIGTEYGEAFTRISSFPISC